MTSSQHRPNVGIVGISGYGVIHLQLAREWAARGELDLAAAVVINPGEAAETVRALNDAGTRLYGSFEDMFRAESGQIELCLIPTGIAWHARITIAALRAGMNVLVEKPLAGSVVEVDAIAAEALVAGRFVAVGFQDIYNPFAQQVKRRLLDDFIGPLRSIKFLGFWPRASGYFTRNAWAGRLSADGAPVFDSPLNNAFAHFLNLGLFLAGPSFEKSAAATDVKSVLWRTNAIESFDTGVVCAQTVAGVRLWFGASHACTETVEPEIEIVGEHGRLIWRHELECIIERAGRPNERVSLPPAEDSRRMMMRAVLARLNDPTVFICGPEIARNHTALIAAAHRSTPIESLPGTVGCQEPPHLGGSILRVEGIEQRLRAAYVHGGLPSR